MHPNSPLNGYDSWGIEAKSWIIEYWHEWYSKPHSGTLVTNMRHEGWRLRQALKWWSADENNIHTKVWSQHRYPHMLPVARLNMKVLPYQCKPPVIKIRRFISKQAPVSKAWSSQRMHSYPSGIISCQQTASLWQWRHGIEVTVISAPWSIPWVPGYTSITGYIQAD